MKNEIYKKVEEIDQTLKAHLKVQIEKLFGSKDVKADLILVVEDIPLDKMPEDSKPEIKGTRKKFHYRGGTDYGFPHLKSVAIEGRVIFPDDPEFETDKTEI